MNECYEYMKVEIKNLDADLQKLGDEGWEAVEIATEFLQERWVRFRRVILGSTQLAAWEHHIFALRAYVPKEWWDHIKSCWWSVLNVPLTHYYGGGSMDMGGYQRLLGKRPGSWRGTDDGDIFECLQNMGYSVWSTYGMSNKLSDILKIKWELSVQQGRDVGTFVAARHWLAHSDLPRLLQESDFVISDVSLESVLDELLSFRESFSKTDRPPLGSALIELWRQHTKGETKSPVPRIVRRIPLPG